jgi:hypothetical protein
MIIGVLLDSGQSILKNDSESFLLPCPKRFPNLRTREVATNEPLGTLVREVLPGLLYFR